jgi:hypothetical protein
VESGQVYSGPGHQRRQPGDEIQRLKDDVRGPIAVLIENPVNREIRPVGTGYYDHDWLENVRARPAVAFLVPRTRSIAATIELAVSIHPVLSRWS